MQKYAIAEIAGYQFRIEEGAKITVPRIDAAEGDSMELDRLLLVNNNGKVQVGTPYVDGASAKAKVVSHSRAKKVVVFKKKRRKGYRKTAGARQHETILEIKKLSA